MSQRNESSRQITGEYDNRKGGGGGEAMTHRTGSQCNDKTFADISIVLLHYGPSWVLFKSGTLYNKGQYTPIFGQSLTRAIQERLVCQVACDFIFVNIFY